MYNFFLRKEEDCSISSEIFLNPTTLRIKKQVAKAASGIITEFVRKSKKSRKSNPKIVILLHAPNPKDDGTASNRAMINIVIHAVPRFIWNLSIRTATSVSSSEMEEVSAASNTKIKNTAAITLEKAILSNTFGSITNIKDGPFASMDESPFENTNTAGTIISPARKATPVSKISTCD